VSVSMIGRPLVIGIGGSHSKTGKTTLATTLLSRLKGWGAIKYTKTAIYSSIVEDKEVLSVKDKDTGRLLESGASAVLWVQSPASGLGEVLPLAIERLSNLEGIIIEGNSAIEFLRPDIIIFISGKDSSRIKESGKRIRDMADIVYDRGKKEITIKGDGIIQGGFEDVAAVVEDMIEGKKTLVRLISENAVNGRIPCSVARRIAEEAGVPYHKIGEIADEIRIKISDCELGCF